MRAPATLKEAATPYRLLAEGFLPPRDDLPPAALADALGDAIRGTRGPVLGTRIEVLRKAAARASVPDLRGEHRRLFIGPARLAAPANESAYRGDGRVMGPSAAEVARLLEDSGRRVSDGVRLLPDHVSVELALAAEFLEKHDLDTFQTILDRHLARWLPAFVSRLETASAHPYYLELARVADRLVGIDLAGGTP